MESGRIVFWLVGEGGGQVGCVRQFKPCVHRIGGPDETANFNSEGHVAGMRSPMGRISFRDSSKGFSGPHPESGGKVRPFLSAGLENKGRIRKKTT